MEPAAPYFGRHGIFREVFHLFFVFTFRTYLDFSCALAFRTNLSEKLFAVVAVTEQSALGHEPTPAGARHSRSMPIVRCGEAMELAGTLKASPVPDINRENIWATSAATINQADGLV